MPIKLNKLGMIKGGDCEIRFRARRNQEKGVKLAVDWLVYNNCIEIKRGWCRIIKIPKKLYSYHWPIDNICKEYGSGAELGWRRFISHIARPLHKKKTKFRLFKLETWGEDAVARKFAVALALRRLTGKSLAGLTDGKPHQDVLYKEWLQEEKGEANG